jgi:GNAT superfamily N-acetyltransferase
MLDIRPFADADVPLGMRLKQRAGWNQLEGDWRRMVAMQPDGCFVAEHDGTAAGTVMTYTFGDVAWVAMMLVEESLRGRGIGRALMEHALAFLDGQHVRTVRLDATPMGQPLYEKLGFVADYSLTRYAGATSGGREVAGVATAGDGQFDAICVLDRRTTGTDRRKLLARLCSERRAEVVVHDGRLEGFLLHRPGSHAVQIGPCIAAAGAGPLLLSDAFRRHAGRPVYIDVPISHEAATALVCQQGLAAQRHLLRMYRGARISEQADMLWCSSGPELG